MGSALETEFKLSHLWRTQSCRGIRTREGTQISFVTGDLRMQILGKTRCSLLSSTRRQGSGKGIGYLSISSRYGDDEVTNTLQVKSRGGLQNWTESLWQLFFDTSQWKHCCDGSYEDRNSCSPGTTPSTGRGGVFIPPDSHCESVTAVTDILAQREGIRLEWSRAPTLASNVYRPACLA